LDAIKDFLHSLHGEGLQQLIQWGGFPILAAIVFAETGLLVGFFLPGDSLLFTAGMLVGSGVLKPPPFLPQGAGAAILSLDLLLMFAAFLGNSTGYWVGSKAGPRLFERPDSRLFKREHLLKTQAFYEKHGGKTIILAEFMPFARTFAPVVAGIAQMSYRRFMMFNVVGVVIWISTMTLLGYTLGGVPFVRQHVEKVIVGIVLLSILPAIIHVLKDRRQASAGH
jgi:membrane-associated protein